MTREQAFEQAADWWVDRVKARSWDNGDSATEHFAGFARTIVPPPDMAILRSAVVAALESESIAVPQYGNMVSELYCDYGCYPVEDECKRRGTRYAAILHGPQKAGVQIKTEGDGFYVMAKGGYAQSWERLPTAVVA